MIQTMRNGRPNRYGVLRLAKGMPPMVQRNGTRVRTALANFMGSPGFT
jgi:hypothetical protein